MTAERCILRLQYTPVGSALRKQVAGFVKYIEHRDQHRDDSRVGGLLKYVAHRDQAATRGDMFGLEGSAGTAERKQLVSFVGRSLEGSKPQLFRNRDGQLQDGRRAVHRLIISPEFADGLELKGVTRAAMTQLERDCGGRLHWIAAEHRNTAHPHTHVVLAGRREVAPGKYRAVAITRARLERMKLAMNREIGRQRQLSLTLRRTASFLQWAEQQTERRRWRSNRLSQRSLAPACIPAVHGLRRLARQYAREAEQEAQRTHDLERSR